MDQTERMKLWRQCFAIIHDDQPYTFFLSRQELDFLDIRLQNVQQLKLGLNSPNEWFVPLADQKITE